jgi:hypothetical protein
MSATDTTEATAATVDEVFHESIRFIDLFEKTLGVYEATSVTDAQRRLHDLIESSLTTLRVNVHSA